ncbi:PREDICTED: protein BCCIP homolog [Polistes dominula]|uniref:Protein BCCIP homolog n=1 Tax=Polistes dominula TaxID=743375 RepID=A0ABM1IUM2_POLDO|nr:PREDICTED: protein BCCIP homolog [Polistes dominula]
MSAPVKRREIQEDVKDDDEEQESSDGEDDEQEQVEESGMEIQVDFEGRSPQDSDFFGIKTLLQQLFLKAQIDLSALTELIISQNYVGSVIRQSEDCDDEDEDEEDTDDIYGVFGITTVINISDKQNVPCIQRLRDLLLELSSEHATDAAYTLIKNVLQNDSQPIGLLINERFMNIPTQISVPLFENLISEMKRATSKKMPFEFSYYILICKLYKGDDKKIEKKKKNKNKNNSESPTIIWSNSEEEIFADKALVSFEFSVENETDSALSGLWTETDEEMKPYRRVLLIEASTLPSIINTIKNQIS